MGFSWVRGWGDEESLPRVPENLQGILGRTIRLSDGVGKRYGWRAARASQA